MGGCLSSSTPPVAPAPPSQDELKKTTVEKILKDTPLPTNGGSKEARVDNYYKKIDDEYLYKWNKGHRADLTSNVDLSKAFVAFVVAENYGEIIAKMLVLASEGSKEKMEVIHEFGLVKHVTKEDLMADKNHCFNEIAREIPKDKFLQEIADYLKTKNGHGFRPL